jgi:hypothetical protein
LESIIDDFEKQQKWIHLKSLRANKRLKLTPIPETAREYEPENLQHEDPWKDVKKMVKKMNKKEKKKIKNAKKLKKRKRSAMKNKMHC